MSDEEIVASVILGQTDEYRKLIERYQQPLLRYAAYLIHDPDLAEDVVQDTFIKAYRNIRGFRSHAKFSSWIYRIAHNTAMDAVKHHHVSLDRMIDDEVLPSHDISTPELIDREITAADVQRCLRQLPWKYREAVMLHYLHHKSYVEISDITHLSVSAVGVRINRAKHQLRSICKLKGVTQ